MTPSPSRWLRNRKEARRQHGAGTTNMRDSQRSRVYAFERSIPGLQARTGSMTLEAADDYAFSVWVKERGRYGFAKRTAPRVEAGRNGGTAYGQHLITLGVWARQPAVVLHELAHCLTPGDQHGPRFVGVAIGLYCRYLGLDRDELLAAAYEHGVKVNLRSIGATPRYGWHKRAVRALQRLGGRAENLVTLAMEMGVSYRVAQGALLTLLRTAAVKMRGKTIILVGEV